MPRLDFVKSHGTGNDFILLLDLDGVLHIRDEEVARLCDRRRGIGADGLIRVVRGESAPVRMDLRNADGSIAEMSGNGIRCLGKFIFDRDIVAGTSFAVETLGGIRELSISAGPDGKAALVGVDMGSPVFEREAIPMSGGPGEAIAEPIEAGGATYDITACSMGNPHAVIFVPDSAAAPVDTVGPAIERHPAFPNGANVEFVQVLGRNRLRMRVWERGVGETLSCGSGASAAVAAGIKTGRTDSEVCVEVRGGELSLTVNETITLAGPAVEVFDGTVDTDRLAAP